MIEFDVLPERDGDRLIAGSRLRGRGGPSAANARGGAGVLAGDRFAGVELDVDLKLPGYELRVLEALRAAGLLERVLISSQYLRASSCSARADPAVRLGWSVPKLTRDPFRSRATRLPAFLALQVFRLVLPWRAARAIRAGAATR